MKRFLKILVPIILSLAIIAGLVWYFFSYDKGLTQDIFCSFGSYFADKENMKAASWFYDLAYKQNYNKDGVAIELADKYIQIGNYTKAEAALYRAIQDGAGVPVYIALSKAYIAQDKLYDAVELLDGVSDPGNMGAIIRTAEAAGAHGVIIPKRRGVGLTATVAKTSAGAVEYMPVVRVANIVSCIDELKEQGFWIFCADMDGETWCQADMKGKIGVVVGSEGFGVSRLTKEHCDFVVSLPMKGHVNSLNASVAAGIVIYEAVRQRNDIRAK